jgi:hypothetical protein
MDSPAYGHEQGSTWQLIARFALGQSRLRPMAKQDQVQPSQWQVQLMCNQANG